MPRRESLAAILKALCDERAVRLMKDHFVDNVVFTAKFDRKSLQFDDPKSSAVKRCKTVGWLVVGFQHKLPFCNARAQRSLNGTREMAHGLDVRISDVSRQQ